jgi:hypothetical protein
VLLCCLLLGPYVRTGPGAIPLAVRRSYPLDARSRGSAVVLATIIPNVSGLLSRLTRLRRRRDAGPGAAAAGQRRP